MPVNERIRAREVRVVGESGEQLGIMLTVQALDLARKRGFDLVEVAVTATPPVCRILDYGKYKYEQAKKEQEARRSQKVSLLREVRLRPKISDHDFESKSRLVKRLLEEGDKVKVSVRFVGREKAHPDIGWRLLQKMTESLKDIATVDRRAIHEEPGISLIMTLANSQKAKTSKEEKGTVDAKVENPQGS